MWCQLGPDLHNGKLPTLCPKRRDQVRAEIAVLQRRVDFTSFRQQTITSVHWCCSAQYFLRNKGMIEVGMLCDYILNRTSFVGDVIDAVTIHSGMYQTGTWTSFSPLVTKKCVCRRLVWVLHSHWSTLIHVTGS